MTATHTARPGTVLGEGAAAQFLTVPQSETSDSNPGSDSDTWTTLVRFAHASDFHITDTESPARLDFIVDDVDDPRYEQHLPTIRPQQLTSTHAAAATLRTIDRMAAAQRLDCAILSGDLLDNGQRNELDRFLALLHGGTVPTTASPGVIEGAQGVDWTDSKVWRPADPQNYWTEHYGFPSGREILDAISQPLTAAPITVPVLLVRGNHDMLLAGTVAWTPFLTELAVGESKPRTLPAGVSAESPQQFLADPDAYFTGDTVTVAPDGRRRPVETDEFPLTVGIDAEHPHGHDYVVRIDSRVAFVVLDTLDTAGHPGGVVSTTQVAWLRETLTALENENLVVAVVSHHGAHYHHVTASTDECITGADFVEILGQFRSVALWLTGHAHIAATTLHTPEGHRGIWEITAASIIDWPCQFQCVDVAENARGDLRITIEQLDYDASTPAAVDELTADLAGLHRLLAANQAGFGTIFPGDGHVVVDRTRVLHLVGERSNV